MTWSIYVINTPIVTYRLGASVLTYITHLLISWVHYDEKISEQGIRATDVVAKQSASETFRK